MISIESFRSSGDGSDPASEGVSSTVDSLVADESYSSDIYRCPNLKHFSNESENGAQSVMGCTRGRRQTRYEGFQGKEDWSE